MPTLYYRMSRYSKTSGLALALLSLVLMSAPPPTGAQTPVRTTPPLIDIKCTKPGQLCDPRYQTVVETGGLLQIRYFAAATHCSSVRIHVYVDGVRRRTSPFLGWFGSPPPFDSLPFETGVIDVGPVPHGRRLLELEAEGDPGGCSPEDLQAWGGSVQIFTTPLPKSPALTLSPPSGTYLLTQLFDFVAIIEGTSLPVEQVKVTFDDMDKTKQFNDFCVAGTLNQPGGTPIFGTPSGSGWSYRCSGLSGAVLGSGLHTAYVCFTFSDKTQVCDSIIWDILKNTEEPKQSQPQPQPLPLPSPPQ